MEKGRLYLVIYKDDDRSRSKHLNFVSESPNFITFLNPRTDKQETFPVMGIIRIEEVKENERV